MKNVNYIMKRNEKERRMKSLLGGLKEKDLKV